MPVTLSRRKALFATGFFFLMDVNVLEVLKNNKVVVGVGRWENLRPFTCELRTGCLYFISFPKIIKLEEELRAAIKNIVCFRSRIFEVIGTCFALSL